MLLPKRQGYGARSSAMRFSLRLSIDNLSRTKKSADIRKEAARFLICKHDHPLANSRAPRMLAESVLSCCAVGQKACRLPVKCDKSSIIVSSASYVRLGTYANVTSLRARL